MLKRHSLTPGHRPIRSFVARPSRYTAAMQQNIKELWPIFGLNLHEPLVLTEVFGRRAPLTVEIGFGNGEALLAQAIAHPEQDFIGIEVYTIGIAQLLAGIKQHHLTNVRIYCADALEVLHNCIPDTCLLAVRLLFPDPWPKARHHKRRIVQTGFAQLVQDKLESGGILYMATDWQDYALHMISVLQQAPGWEQMEVDPKFIKLNRIETKFAQRGSRLGHGTWDIVFRKCHLSNILS